MRLVLASASPSRLRLLRLAGVEPEVRVSRVDEEAVAAEAGAVDAVGYVQLLATAKARAVAAAVRADAGHSEAAGARVDMPTGRPDVEAAGAALVLGCDSAFELDGVVYGKPHRREVAAARWREMRGRRGTLHTGHTLIDLGTGQERHAVRSTELDFAHVSDAEIDWYVASGEPLPVAGAFTLDGLASAFISRISGDPHAVVGLSIAALRELAADLGHAWPDLVTPGSGGGWARGFRPSEGVAGRIPLVPPESPRPAAPRSDADAGAGS